MTERASRLTSSAGFSVLQTLLFSLPLPPPCCIIKKTLKRRCFRLRFLHLSDLHLGKRVCEFSMLDDQRYILEQILSLLDSTPVDGVLLAGDFYDKPVPPAEAVRLLDWFLTQLAERRLPVFAISGNHDSADRMGLAQLYQIRGRVGRSGRKAYAYFTFRRDKTLTDIAQKRLSAIREFTAFGSGFRIAMRDLQIRGAGSLLGHSQHGHMEAVGYDLYVKMLGQAIARAKGEPIQRDKSECLVDLRVDAFIPEKYIADGPGRIEAYKRIAAIQTPEDAADVLDELIDRYGDPPPSVSDLVNVSLVRVQAAAVGVYEVTQKKDTLLLQVETLDVAMIRGLLIAFNGRVTAGAGTKPYLSVTLQPDEKPLELLQSILKAMADILAAPPEENTGKK